MKPVDQTILSSEDGTIHGNCLEACIASLIECDISEVPSLREGNGKWFHAMYKFLESRGYECDGTCHRDSLGFNELFDGEYEGVDGFIITCGASFRAYVVNGHCVIYKNAMMAHDPHPSRKGIKTIEYFLLIRRPDKVSHIPEPLAQSQGKDTHLSLEKT